MELRLTCVTPDHRHVTRDSGLEEEHRSVDHSDRETHANWQ